MRRNHACLTTKSTDTPHTVLPGTPQHLHQGLTPPTCSIRSPFPNTSHPPHMDLLPCTNFPSKQVFQKSCQRTFEYVLLRNRHILNSDPFGREITSLSQFLRAKPPKQNLRGWQLISQWWVPDVDSLACHLGSQTTRPREGLLLLPASHSSFPAVT